MLNEYSFDSIYIRHAIDESPDDKYFTMHIHDQCEIYFFLSGSVEYLVEGSKYPLKDKSVMIMSPAEAHKPKIVGEKRYERYAINFPLSFVKDIDPEGRLVRAFTDRPLGKSNMLYDGIDMGQLEGLFSQMLEQADDYDRRLTIKTHLMMILHIISKAYDGQRLTDKKPKTTSERIVEYVSRHLSEDISVPSLAEHFYLSQSQFCRIFRQATGASPWEYITKKRLTRAKEMIRSGASAQSAAEGCGFKDYSSFYRAYKKHFGQSPSEKAQ